MRDILFPARPLELRLAYTGPRGSGKTTNLDIIRQAIDRLELASVTGTSISSIGKAPIDFLYFEAQRGTRTRLGFRLSTLPQIEDYFHLWKMMLKSCHGLVIVLDSQMEKIEENQSCIGRVMDYLSLWDLPLHEFPCVLQYNKSDLPGALPRELLDEKLNPFGKVSFPACARNREGVLLTFMAIVEELLPSMESASSHRERSGG